MMHLRQKSDRSVQAAKYIATRLIPYPSQKSSFLRDVECRYHALEIFYFIQDAAQALLPILQTVATGYLLYDRLKKTRSKSNEPDIKEVYGRIEKQEVIIYQKAVKRLSNRLNTHPKERNRSTQKALCTHESILVALIDHAKGGRRMRRICKELMTKSPKEIELYLKKYRNR